MRVGITAHFQFSIFSGGGASSVLAIAETFKAMGHSVTLININGKQDWWDDLHALKKLYECVNVDDIKEPFDLVLEVANTLANKDVRQRCGKYCVWVIRKPMVITEIENTIFPVSLGHRNLEGLSAVWTLDQEVYADEHQYLETLARVPVISVPFVWSPTLVETYRKEINAPSWIQIAIQITQQAGKPLPWSVHICETNNSATSSSTIPMVILQEAKRQGQFYFSKYKLHNAQPIENSEYFKTNVVKHCHIQDLSGDFIGRQRVADWVSDPMSCVVGHLRFRNVRHYLLDTLWCGIPLVHNSPLVKKISPPEYQGYFYESNQIVDGAAALLKIQQDITTGKGMFSPNALSMMQQNIIQRVSPISPNVQEGWKKALLTISAAPVPSPVVAPAPVVATAPAPVVPSVSQTEFNILFTDMWDDFNPDYNMFVLMVQEGSKNLSPRPVVRGFSLETLPSNIQPNILIFGPFGSQWSEERWATVPKAHFTGENTEPVIKPTVFLNMGYAHMEFVNEQYIRLPLWMLEIDWFGCDVNKIINPKPLSLDRCLNVFPSEITQKERFCAFVVTNPCNPVRNSAFHWLSQYKKVDSAGRLFNNIGDEIFAGRGGGGGELKKHDFLKKYKFCIAYENASSQGYTTEKLLHAKAAGCIPIYWGDPKVERDFDTKGFIDARKFTTPEEIIKAVCEIDQNEELYRKMFMTPALDEYKRDLVRRHLSQIAFMMLKHGLPSANITNDKIPRFLGAANSKEAAELAKAREPTTVVSSSHIAARLLNQPKNPSFVLNQNPLVLTMASERFLPSLTQLLASVLAQSKVAAGLEARIWLMDDVSPDIEKNLVEDFKFAKFLRFPKETPADFPDYWEAQHFAWKLWLLDAVSQDTSVSGRLVLYMDSGVFLSRLPKSWLQIVEENGICLLEDPRQENRRWCHAAFCQALNVTESEKDSQQIWAGCLAFKAGDAVAKQLFSEASVWSKRRDVIVGPKWEGVRDGKPFGHRHDQSILSILSQRLGIVRYPMDDIYCDHSLRRTFMTGKALYVHRGGFTVHKPFAKFIDEAYVVNLDKREDRMKMLYTNNPELKDRVHRLSAVNGRTLTLTPAIARLFKPNDFFWKKSVMGCALSHLTLWWQLINEKPEIRNYLILEDDAKLQPGWEAKWEAAAPYIPDDYDVVYLGGILPPNRPGFEKCKERVNQYISRVAPNQTFGQREPNRYFHWCNYAYVLSKSGAQKVLDILMENDGYWTSGDHMVCNRVDVLNHYFVDPLIAGCYQDDDPKYQNSAFNNFNRIDGFDSDLWNNDERFSAMEIQLMLEGKDNTVIDIVKALKDAKGAPVVTTPVVPVQQTEIVIGKEESKPADAELKQLVQKIYAQPPSVAKRSFVTLKQHKFDGQNAYERIWLEECIGKETPFVIREIGFEDAPPSDKPIVIVQRPHIEAYCRLFSKWEAAGAEFYVLHVSDEHKQDSLAFYEFSSCLGIVRIYHRNDIPESAKNKTMILPLGYHWTLGAGSDDPLNKTPRLPFRNNIWSFFGTNWQNRKDLLAPLLQIQPNNFRLVDTWESPDKLTRNQYVASLLDTIFVPCPPGNNVETFRLYEALECGCVPIYVKENGDEAYVDMLQTELGLLPVSNWNEAFILMVHFLKEKELLENYRNSLLTRWKTWKERLGNDMRKTWAL